MERENPKNRLFETYIDIPNRIDHDYWPEHVLHHLTRTPCQLVGHFERHTGVQKAQHN